MWALAPVTPKCRGNKNKEDIDNNTNKQKKAFIIAQSPMENTCRDILSKMGDSTIIRSHPSCDQRTTRGLYNNYTASKHMDAKNVPIFFVLAATFCSKKL